MNRKILIVSIVVCAVLVITAAVGYSLGIRKKRIPHHKYGDVVINARSEKNNMAPVVFSHWLHRSRYTCRVCHEELKFSLKTNGSGITDSAINEGRFCGACHNGKEAFASEESSADGKAVRNCDRCHSYGKNVKPEKNFFEFTKDFPRSRFGNGINWIKALEDGVIKLKESLGGKLEKIDLSDISDELFEPKEPAMPDVIFWHEDHALLNGCTICHPGIFKDEKDKKQAFTMEDIFAGKYCGQCHGKVSFPTLDCQRCHTTLY